MGYPFSARRNSAPVSTIIAEGLDHYVCPAAPMCFLPLETYPHIRADSFDITVRNSGVWALLLDPAGDRLSNEAIVGTATSDSTRFLPSNNLSR